MSTSPGCDNAPWPHAVTGCSLCPPYSFRGANIEHPVTRLSPERLGRPRRGSPRLLGRLDPYLPSLDDHPPHANPKRPKGF